MSRRWMFRAVLLAAMLVALLAMGGCGLLVRKGVESATGVKVDQGTGQVTVTGKDGGTATIQQGKLPAGMPSDFPVYQGAVKFGNKVATSQGTTYQIVIETADSAETIGNWYETKLKAAGWKIDARNDVTTNGKAITTISAKSGTSQAMIIGGQGADTTQNSVNITLTTK